MADWSPQCHQLQSDESVTRSPAISWGGRISAKMPLPMGVVSRDPDFEGLPNPNLVMKSGTKETRKVDGLYIIPAKLRDFQSPACSFFIARLLPPARPPGGNHSHSVIYPLLRPNNCFNFVSSDAFLLPFHVAVYACLLGRTVYVCRCGSMVIESAPLLASPPANAAFTPPGRFD